MALISVIMGVYNCTNFSLLRKSVNSIIEQTVNDWEFIICNDGSTDNTLKELKKLENLDHRIRVISYDKNRGLAYALNECINIADGKYIARQDDDDISMPYRFESQLAIFNAHPEYSIVGSNAIVYDGEKDWGEYKTEEKPMIKSFLWTNPFAHPTVMFEASALKKSGCYRVSKETRRCEDYDLFMRMYAKGYIGYNIQKNLYKYRIVNGLKKYRPFKYRIDEAIVRWKGYKALGLFPKGIPFIIKPIFIGLIPQRFFKIIRNRVYDK